MDPVALAHQVIDILVPVLPIIYAGGKVVADKGKDLLIEGGKAVVDKSKDMLLEKSIEKVSPEVIDRAKYLLKKLSPKMSESLEKVLATLSKNSEDLKAKEGLQQEILKLLGENPDLAREIEIIINFNVENIDQLAVGNYNTFFNFGTPSGDEYIKIIEYLDQKRKETRNQEILSRYNPSALPDYPNRLKQFITENRSEELRKALTYIEKHKVLIFSGIGGVGKSTLARALVDLRPVNVPKPFWFSFNLNQDAKLGDILEKLAAYMNAPEIASFKTEKREPEKTDVDKLTDELHKRNEIWLILDDLSIVLEDQQFTDKGIELLFSTLRYNTHNAKIIITSRTLPVFETGEKLIDVVEDEDKQDLKGLKPNFAVNYLEKNGLSCIEYKKLEELATGVDGHPLALKILVELVKEFGAKDILDDLSMYQKDKEDTILKARKLFDKLAGDEKELLERISVYREPVNMKGLKEMFTENTPKNSVRKLIDKSLLETDHNGSYWLHPLVQEFSYEDLKNKKEAHMHAAKYYLTFPPQKNPIKKENLQPAIEAHYHACEAGEYDLAATIVWQYNLYFLLDLWGNPKTLIEINEKLLPNDHFKDVPILKDKQIHGSVLGSLGNAYYNLSEYRKAIKYYEQALKIAKEVGDRKSEGIWLGSLGNVFNELSKPKKAIEYYEQALKIAKEVGDMYLEGRWLGNLGNAYNDLSGPRKAIDYHEKALKIANEIGHRYLEGRLFGNLGSAYIGMGELKKATEYYEQALRIAKEVGDRKSEGRMLGNMGLAYSDTGDSKKAIEYYEQALKIAKEIGHRYLEGRFLGNLGLAYSDLGEPRKSIEYYEKALKISREIGDRRAEGADLGNLGLAYSDLGDPIKAIEFLNESLTIGKTIEDPRIIRFCEQKLKDLEGSDE